ncbi:hypothetical protein [Paucibacter sp. B51]|uniref:hypothetical protein n=1 Tax=Paucibacter sp. B51 TaxID=2993315 RepID=UPI0022EBFA99|nr:hypothetical protein [Paucibacter sp. B51]
MNSFGRPLLLGLALLCAVAPLRAESLASCYGGKLSAPQIGLSKELFVVVDQTVLLDDGLKQQVANQVRPFLAPNHAVSLIVFSAYTQGMYTRELVAVQHDAQLSAAQRNEVPKPLLSKLDACLSAQAPRAAQIIGAALRDAFQGSSGGIAKSDVMASLKDISSRVRQSKAKERVVLLVSDMLENSSVSSFYSAQSVRKIDPVKELQLAQEQQLFADFDQARVYVVGAGLLNDAGKSKTAYRDPKTMAALKAFWQQYFEKSSARLQEFGQPALLNPVQ